MTAQEIASLKAKQLHRGTNGRAFLGVCFLCIPALLMPSCGTVRAGELVPCFTPGEDCTAFVVQEIDGAVGELLVQGYSLTSLPILEAIARAKERGVDVKVILDRQNEQKPSTGATYLVNHGIAPLIDDRALKANNNVMVIDRRGVITGSFDFTKVAQERNAENVLLINDDPVLAAAYTANWEQRAAVSRPLRDFRRSRRP
jgi:phosphatidylserine/phosphatidylglycerophosphate/cardiolipin synthase-like enzyme